MPPVVEPPQLYAEYRIAPICGISYTGTMTPIVLRLRELREAAGLTQEQLAELVGTRQGTISDHERGKATRIDYDLIERLADALGVEPGSLFKSVPKV